MSWIAFTDDVPAALVESDVAVVLAYFPQQVALPCRGIRPVQMVRARIGPDETQDVFYCAGTGLLLSDTPTHWQPLPDAPQGASNE